MISLYLNLLALHLYTVITHSELISTLQRISSNLNLLALLQNTAISYSELNGTTLLCQHISNSNVELPVELKQHSYKIEHICNI